MRELLVTYWRTLQLVRFSLLTIAAMLALGFTTRYSGVDATMGLAFAQTGVLYPVLRHDARLAWRRADRVRHVVQRAVRQPAAHHRRAAGPEPDLDGRGQQFGRRHGQDDRRPVDRRRKHGDTLVRARGRRSSATCSSTASRSRSSSACSSSCRRTCRRSRRWWCGSVPVTSVRFQPDRVTCPTARLKVRLKLGTTTQFSVPGVSGPALTGPVRSNPDAQKSSTIFSTSGQAAGTAC